MTILTRRSTLQQLQKETAAKPYIIPKFQELSLDTDLSELENDIADILPSFASADYDWKCFGYLLEEANKPTTSGREAKSECETNVVRFVKPDVEPIGKGRRRITSSGSKAPKTTSDSVTSNVRKEVINPADISLGGDTFDYTKDEVKKEEESPDDNESIATGVARRRRTSTTLSKSDDETMPRATKERRMSESQLEKGNEFEDQHQKQNHSNQQIIEIDRGALHCICQTFYDDTKFYVMCDMCTGWFHGDCVNVSEKQAAKMDGWTCEQCLEEEQRIKDAPQLYCLCRTPYDDTKFYVGCDSCQGWFHPECVNITRKAAEEAADYICPLCKAAEEEERQKGYESSSSETSTISKASTNLVRSDYTYVMQLLELLLEHRMSSPFRKPVNLDEFPDYAQVIKHPMDISTIGKRVEGLEYLHLSDFVADVNLMFENAKKYNPKDHAIFKCAETMQEVFEKKLLEARDAIRMNHEKTMPRRRMISEGQITLDTVLNIETDQLIQFDPNTELQMYDY